MAPKKSNTNRRLAFESLEARQMLTSFGVPWPEASNLTLSFAPDGTQIGSQTSKLFQTLAQGDSPANWQEDVLRAFQTWAVEANVNIGLVPDGGQAVGTPGLKQGDPRFGDVRIGAFPMASDVLAVADPYDPFVANTWVGDVFLNSDVQFDAGNPGANYDLFSVLLHEAGHVFGLSHSPDPASPMYEHFNAAQQPYLTAADTAALQAIYGARSPDQFDAAVANDTQESASSINLTDTAGKAWSAEVQADITSLNDSDMYRILVPAGTRAIDVKLNAAGVSLLVPRLSVLDASGAAVATTAAADSLHNDVSLSLNNLAAGGVYYVKVQSARSDVFGIGGYKLEVSPEGAQLSSDEVSTSVYYPGNAPPTPTTDPRIGGALELTTTPGYVEHTYYETDATLTINAPVQTYRVRSADLATGITNVMTVLVASDDSQMRPQVAVFDDQGRLINSSIAYQANGKIEIQVSSVESNRDYIVRVSDAGALAQPVDCEITVDFDADGDHLATFVNDSLSGEQTEVVRELDVVQSQQFHFVLSTSDWNNAAESGLQMSIEDALSQTVFTMSARDGATRSQDVFLDAGHYTVRFSSVNRPSDATVTFQLSGLTMSEPLGPQLRDTTLEPVEPAVEAALGQLSFYWLPASSAAPTDAAIALLTDASTFQLSQDTPPPPLQVFPASLATTAANRLGTSLNSRMAAVSNAPPTVQRQRAVPNQASQEPGAGRESRVRNNRLPLSPPFWQSDSRSTPSPAISRNSVTWQSVAQAELARLTIECMAAPPVAAPSSEHRASGAPAQSSQMPDAASSTLLKPESEHPHSGFSLVFGAMVAGLFLPICQSPILNLLRRGITHWRAKARNLSQSRGRNSKYR